MSIPANVPDGHATRMPRRCANHVRTALASLAELETELELCRRIGYLTEAQLQPVWPQIERTGKLLHGLLRAKEAQALKAGIVTLALLTACLTAAALLR